VLWVSLVLSGLAGIPGSAGAFPGLAAAEFDRVMAVNVRGIFLVLRGSSIVSTARPSGGAGAWDFGALDARTYKGAAT
jgi:hypothetical protein